MTKDEATFLAGNFAYPDYCPHCLTYQQKLYVMSLVIIILARTPHASFSTYVWGHA